MKSNHNFHQECYAINFVLENNADIFNEVQSKNACARRKKFTSVDAWAVQKNYKRRAVANSILYRF